MGVIGRFKIIVALGLVAVFTVAMAQTDGREGLIDIMFNAQGKPFAKVQQQTREPKILIDTVEVRAGWGELALNSRFSDREHSVTPTSIDHCFAMITKVVDDSTSLVGDTIARSFSYTLSKDKTRLLVRSSVTDDTVRAVVVAILK